MYQRQSGYVARLVSDRGFGFIRAVDGADVFFHRSACDGGCRFEALTVGDGVSFFTEHDRDGRLRANGVRFVPRAES